MDIYIIDFSPIDLTTVYSVGSIMAEDDIPQDFNNTLPNDVWTNIDSDGVVVFDKSSKKLVGVRTTDASNNDFHSSDSFS